MRSGALKRVCIVTTAMSLFLLASHAYAENWKGVDETVVGRAAAANGRAARPLICLEGDAQLFAFLVAGVAGGFALGWFFRDFISKKGEK